MTQTPQNSRFQSTIITGDDLDPDRMLPVQQGGWDGHTDRRTQKRPNDDEPLTTGEFEKRIAGFGHYTAETINTRFAVFEEKILERIEDLDKTLKSGFPDGDLAEHRRDHEIQIKFENERATLYK